MQGINGYSQFMSHSMPSAAGVLELFRHLSSWSPTLHGRVLEVRTTVTLPETIRRRRVHLVSLSSCDAEEQCRTEQST